MRQQRQYHKETIAPPKQKKKKKWSGRSFEPFSSHHRIDISSWFSLFNEIIMARRSQHYAKLVYAMPRLNVDLFALPGARKI